MKDSPACGLSLHNQSKWSAGADCAAPRQYESGCDQGMIRAQTANIDFFEMQAVSAGSRCESRSVVLSYEFEAAASPAPVHERRRGLGRVVREKCFQIAPVPVASGTIELTGDLAGEGGRAGVIPGHHRSAAGPAARNSGSQK